METAILGGGCFWCLEAVFEQLEGVENVVSGYCGGTVAGPTYGQVCDGNTGHAEVVRISFDSKKISYRDLLGVFFSIHDPTTPNRQGYDVGSQYRSVIVAQSPEQESDARQIVLELEKQEVWKEPIVTEILHAQTFYPAEEYHHQYFRRNPEQGYCSVVINPKVAKFRKSHADLLKAEYR